MNAGDTKTFEPDLWVENYADALFDYTLLRVQDRGLAEDIVQESFLSAWKSRSSFNGSSERAWLFTICKNKIIDHYRSRGRARQSSVDHYFDDEDHWTDKAKPLPISVDLTSQLDLKDFYKILNACRSKLNQTQYAVFTMKYLDNLETGEICKHLNISLKNYWVLIHRAKLQLRECLQINWINIK